METFPAILPVEAKEPGYLHLQVIQPVPPLAEKFNEYADVEELRTIIHGLRGRKFMLDCGHRVTLGHFLGNDIFIRNGKKCAIVCGDCA